MKHADKKVGTTAAKKVADKADKAVKEHAKGGAVKVRGTGAATKGLFARGPMA